MNKHTITIENVDITIYESQPEGQPVLLIHGNSLSGRLFSKQLESDIGERYRLISFDLPGHGDSARAVDPSEMYSVTGYINIVVGVYKQLGLSNAILVGHSLGGHLAIEAAEKLPEAAGFVIFGTPPLGIPPAMEQAFLPNPAMGLAFKPDLTEEETAVLTVAFVGGDEADKEIVSVITGTDSNVRPHLGGAIAGGQMKDEVAVVSSISKPLAIFHGEHDKLVSLDYLKNLNAPTLWKNEVQVISNSGHSPHWENAREFNNLLAYFVEEVSG